MDSPETSPAQPNLPPNIRHAPGLTLMAAEAILLARAFPDNQEIFVEREFRSGYSGAVVLLVSPGSGQAQVVVKLGSATELQREYAAYRQYVKQASPQNTARLQGEPLLTDDEQLALLSYTFAGGDPRRPTNSLQAYYESKGGQATAAVLDRVFRTYGRQWWAINRPQKFVVSEQYDRLLPVHLKLKPAKTNETNPRTLVAGQINAGALRDLQPDQSIRLKGFRVAEIRQDRQEVKLTANPPPGEASAPLRIRLETNEIARYRPGEQLEQLDAVITATRQTLLAEAARSALPTFDPEATHLSLNSRTYPNPLLNISELLNRAIETKVSTIHGDLNLQNILVDEETGFAWLIDFAETRRGPALFDLQRLESQIITKLLPPTIVQAGLEPIVVADLLESLHADPPSPTAPYTVLQESYTVLVTLRRLARQYLMDDRDWDEYYLGLVITLVGSLKYPELEATGRQLALIGAAVAQESIGKPITTGSFAPKGGRAVPVQGRGGVAVVESPVAQPSSHPIRWLGWIGQIFGRKPASGPPLALVINVEGQVEVRRKASDRVIPAAFGMQLFPEDAVITYEASASDIVCHNGFLFHLDRHSTLVVRCEEIDDRPPLGRLPTDVSQRLTRPSAGTLMSQADLAAVEQAIKILSLSNRAQGFLQAKLYQQSGLLNEAIRQLEDLANQGKTPGLTQALGDAYLQAKSLDRAEANYTSALNEATFRGDLIGQAEARVGLGRIAEANDEADVATTHWQTAEELYRQEGYSTQAAGIAALKLFVGQSGVWLRKLWMEDQTSTPILEEKPISTKSSSRQFWPALNWVGSAVVLLIFFIVFSTSYYWWSSLAQLDDGWVTCDQGCTLSLRDGAKVTLPSEGINGPLKLRAREIPAAELMNRDLEDDLALSDAAKQLPPHRKLYGTVYRFEMDGTPPSVALFSLSTDADAFFTQDMYAWEGRTDWRLLAAHTNPSAGEMIAQFESLPLALAVMQTEPNVPTISANLAPDIALPAEAGGVLSELFVSGFNVQADGTIQTNPTLPAVETTAVLIPSLRNWRDNGAFSADVNTILNNPTLRQRHLEAIIGLALTGGYPMIQLDYRGLDQISEQVFSMFVTDLASALHEQDRALLVRVAAPVQVSATVWETGAYDWSVIGQVADRLQVPLPTDPIALAEGQATAQLIWAVSQVDRYKLQAVLSLQNLDTSARQQAKPLTEDTLAQLGPLQASAQENLEPGDLVSLTLSGGVLQVDPASGMLRFEGSDESGEPRQFYVHTNTSLNFWLQRVARYNLGGVVLEDILTGSSDAETWRVLQAYRSLETVPVENEMVWVWTTTPAGNAAEVLREDIFPLVEPDYGWPVPDAAGEYQVEVALSTDGGTSMLPIASLSFSIESGPTPTSTSEAIAAIPTPTPTPSTLTPSPTPTDTDTPIPLPPTPTPQRFLLAYTKWDGYFHNLYIADTDGQNEQFVFSRAAGPSFSPDKKRLFFFGEQGVNQQIRENNVACDFGTISEGIVAVDLPSPLRDICQVQTGIWTCERKEIDIGLGPSDVCAANNIFVYQNLDWKVGSARWTRTSPTGDSVAFDADLGGGYRINFRAVDPTSQQFHFEIPGEQASWSPDGEKLVYRSGRNNQAGLWISNRDDSNPIRITADNTDSFPAWSPDGQTIAFTREVEGDVEIGIMNPDGTNLRRLTNAKGPDTLPVFTPSGEIIFRSARSGSWGIWKMNGDGTNQREIIPNAEVSHIDWAFDRMDVK